MYGPVHLALGSCAIVFVRKQQIITNEVPYDNSFVPASGRQDVRIRLAELYGEYTVSMSR